MQNFERSGFYVSKADSPLDHRGCNRVQAKVGILGIIARAN